MQVTAVFDMLCNEMASSSLQMSEEPKIMLPKKVFFVLTYRSFALSLNKIGCTRKQKENVFSLLFHSFALPLQKNRCHACLNDRWINIKSYGED